MSTSRARRRHTRLVSTLTIWAVLTAPLLWTPEASATHGKDGDPISEVPDLFSGGASYGTLPSHDDSTEPNGTSIESCFYGDGGSVYKFTAVIRTEVSLVVKDDIGGVTLCMVGLYRQHFAGNTLPGFYRFPDLDNYAVAQSFCPDANSLCQLKWIIPEDDTYYLAFWPADTFPTLKYATFNFEVKVRQPTSTALKVAGHFGKSGGCYKVRQGKSFSGIATVSPQATGNVQFTLERFDRSAERWRRVAKFVKGLVSSSAMLVRKLFKIARYRLRAQFQGDNTRAPSSSPNRCIKVLPRA